MAKRLVITSLSDTKILLDDNSFATHPFNDLVQYLIKKSWSRETSASPNLWTRDNPAIGQCAVTALLFQGMIGGTILRTEIKGFGSHYWNKLTYPEYVTVEYDLTRGQFPSDLKITEAMMVDRNEILQSERAKEFRTSQRYRILRHRFLKFMSDELHLRIDR